MKICLSGMKFIRPLFFIFLLMLCNACDQSDQERLIGKWQNEQDWFEFKENHQYSSGKDDIKMVDHFEYVLDPAASELNLYTDDKNTTYYLLYQFRGNDTLAVRNKLSTNKDFILFVRKSK